MKLLDFGLAKAMPKADKGSLTSLPTQQGLTQEGSILGTFQYMAPEQLEGRDADARTDIFALGSVLYEMATGLKAFAGGSQASLISSIMTREPAPIAAAQPASPPALERIVRTCLAKDPEERWQSAADVKRELKWIAEGSQTDGSRVAATAAPRRAGWLPWTIAAAGALAAAGMAIAARRAPAQPSERMLFSIVPTERTVNNDFFALSPDGKALAFVGIAGGKSLVRLRSIGSEEVRALPGTDSPESVFWSPDGRSLGFVSRGKLRRIDIATGEISSLADAEVGRGGSWGIRGDILFAQKAVGVIYRVLASGGPTTPVTTFEKGDLVHRWPQILPDGKRFLFYVKTGNPETSGTYLASVGAPGRKLVLRNGATGVFAPPDTLLYARGEALLAQPFDLARAELTGAPVPITRPVMRAELGSFLDLFAVSESGLLVFRPGSAQRQLTLLDRRGTVVRKFGTPGVIMSVALSPDDREAAICTRSVETGAFTSSLVDLARDVVTPLAESAAMPAWSPDGRFVFYRHEGQNYEIWRKAAHGDLNEASIGIADSFASPHEVSTDGRYLLYTRMGGNFDVGMKDLREDSPPRILLGGAFDERSPHFSPDGRWFVYSSDEAGQSEIFVRRFPMTEEKWRVSTSGGQQPSWSRDGKEIFFVTLDGRFTAVPVSAGTSFAVGEAQALFRTPVRLNSVSNQYAASADGQRFLMTVPTQDFESEFFRVLVNWRAKP